MKRHLLFGTLLCCIHCGDAVEDSAATDFVRESVSYATTPVKYILDTDIASDCDDAGAVAMVHQLASLGEVDILGMMVSTGGTCGAPALDAINTYYGRPNVPIGTLKQPSFWSGGGYSEPSGAFNYDKYNCYLADNYPNDLQSGANAPNATTLYRALLAAQPDGSVVINSIGPLINLYYLLQSGPDAASTLSGVELIRRKVRMLVVCGGRNPTGTSSNFSKEDAEVYAKPVIDGWPGRVVFNGNEVGGAINTGFAINTAATVGSPARKAYEIFFGSDLQRRPSNDQAGMLYAIRGARDYYTLHDSGRQTMDTAGTTTWATSDGGKDHAYLVKATTDSRLQQVIEGLMTGAAAASGSCDPFESTPGYVACGETATSCAFVAQLDQVRSCSDVCNAVGSTCVAAYSNATGSCSTNSTLTCAATGSGDNVCHCAKIDEPEPSDCSAFEDTPGYRQCAMTATTCRFVAQLDQVRSCSDACQAAGSSCVAAYANATGSCSVNSTITCGAVGSGDNICECQR